MRLLGNRPLLVSLGWCAGLTLVVGLLIVGSLVHLAAQRRAVAALQRTVREQEALLGQRSDAQAASTSLEQTESALQEWRAMIESDALRIAALSAAARASDVVLASFETLENEQEETRPFVTRSYRLLVVGPYQELARFFDQVYAARGLAAIDDLQIEAGEALDPGRLQASLEVTWYGPVSGVRALGGALP